MSVNSPQLERTNLPTSAPNKDSNQPAHPHSLIRVCVVRMKKLDIAKDVKSAPSKDSDQIAQMRSLILIFAGRTCLKVSFFDTVAHIRLAPVSSD